MLVGYLGLCGHESTDMLCPSGDVLWISRCKHVTLEKGFEMQKRGSFCGTRDSKNYN